MKEEADANSTLYARIATLELQVLELFKRCDDLLALAEFSQRMHKEHIAARNNEDQIELDLPKTKH